MRTPALLLPLIALAACAAAPPPAVWVARGAGTLQCESKAIEVDRFVAELRAAGVTPTGAHACADDGRMRAMRCGGADGRLIAFPVRESDVAGARRAGFVPLDQMPSARRVPCP